MYSYNFNFPEKSVLTLYSLFYSYPGSDYNLFKLPFYSHGEVSDLKYIYPHHSRCNHFPRFPAQMDRFDIHFTSRLYRYKILTTIHLKFLFILKAGSELGESGQNLVLTANRQ